MVVDKLNQKKITDSSQSEKKRKNFIPLKYNSFQEMV